jgi:hypothetical protein
LRIRQPKRLHRHVSTPFRDSTIDILSLEIRSICGERENANLDDLFRSANRGDIIDAVFDPLKGNTRTSKKALPSLSEANSAGIALKQGSAKLIFKIADAPAHHRFLNTQYCCRLAKASFFDAKTR